MSGFVVVDVDTVVIAVAELAQTQPRRVGRRLEQAVQTIVAFNQQLPIEVAAHRETFTGAEYRAAQSNRAHVDCSALLVGVDQRFATLRMGANVDAHFISHAPASTQQAARAFIAAVVEALPVNRQQAG